MKPYLAPRQFTWIAAVAFVVWAIAVAVIQSRHDKDAAVVTSTEPGKAEAPESELARCGTILPDDVGLLESCRHIWAENRQHFFLSTKSPPSPMAPTPDAPLAPAAKRDGIPSRDIDQSRAR
jgi:conjugative transfer region protein TrbK